jgi:hypothetical protein
MLGCLMVPAIGGAVSLIQSAKAVEFEIIRTVVGEVIGLNVQDTPQVIVVKVILPSKEEMIVGATVGPEVTIVRGKQPIGLADLTVGETVTFTYLKNQDGLVARAIHARKTGG